MRRHCHRASVIAAAVLIAASALLPGSAGSKARDWIEATGEAVADDARTLLDIKQEAISKARGRAVERALGIQIRGESIVRDFAAQLDFVASLSAGRIVEENILRWEADVINYKDGAAPVITYRVLLKARIAPDSEAADPAFKIHAALNRTVFRPNDDVILRIKTTTDCYLTIFVVTENNQAFLVYPNKYKTGNVIKAGEAFVYPSDGDRARGLTLQAGLLPGKARAKEMFKIIATKKQIRFTPDAFAEGVGLDAYTRETSTLSELVRELIMIPANERTESCVPYEIVK